jgi:uncharacterized membrane protein
MMLANMQRFGPGPWGPGRHAFWPLGGLVLWALLVGLLAFVVVMLLKRREAAGPGSTGTGIATPAAAATVPIAPESPIDVAKMRYARGELTKEEFEALKQDLQ